MDLFYKRLEEDLNMLRYILFPLKIPVGGYYALAKVELYMFSI